jgi:hypothetical protein
MGVCVQPFGPQSSAVHDSLSLHCVGSHIDFATTISFDLGESPARLYAMSET